MDLQPLYFGERPPDTFLGLFAKPVHNGTKPTPRPFRSPRGMTFDILAHAIRPVQVIQKRLSKLKTELAPNWLGIV